jgi:hypothetical protein
LQHGDDETCSLVADKQSRVLSFFKDFLGDIGNDNNVLVLSMINDVFDYFLFCIKMIILCEAMVEMMWFVKQAMSIVQGRERIFKASTNFPWKASRIKWVVETNLRPKMKDKKAPIPVRQDDLNDRKNKSSMS